MFVYLLGVAISSICSFKNGFISSSESLRKCRNLNGTSVGGKIRKSLLLKRFQKLFVKDNHHK